MSECIEVKLVDSFVKNKIGDGNGESTIYLGGKLKHQLILDVFGGDVLAYIEDIWFILYRVKFHIFLGNGWGLWVIRRNTLDDSINAVATEDN